MTRLVVLVLVAVLIWYGLESLLARLRAGLPGAGRPDLPRPGGTPAEHLVRCAACGTYVPQSRAVRDGGGGAYCSPVCLSAPRSA